MTLDSGDLKHNEKKVVCPINVDKMSIAKWMEEKKAANEKLFHGYRSKSVIDTHVKWKMLQPRLCSTV